MKNRPCFQAFSLFLAFALQSVAQQDPRNALFSPALKHPGGNPKTLDVNFTADKTSGPSPLTVKFTDLSTGNPNSWSWQFGDGGISAEQNPVHTYQQEGTFNVKLTISDGSSFASLEKMNYIVVNNSYTNCDSLHYPLSDTLYYYYYKPPNSGYLTGNNSFGDKAVADFFDNTRENVSITDLYADFGLAKRDTSNDEHIIFAVWSVNGIDGNPLTVLGTDTLPLSDIVADASALRLTHVSFDSPVFLSGSFFAGLYLPVRVGDTLAVMTSKMNALPANTAYILDRFDKWSTLESLTSGARFTTAIYPQVCQAEAIPESSMEMQARVFPNPATGWFNTALPFEPVSPSEIVITDQLGNRLLEGFFSGKISGQIRIQDLNPGIYLVTVLNGRSVFKNKLVVR